MSNNLNDEILVIKLLQQQLDEIEERQEELAGSLDQTLEKLQDLRHQVDLLRKQIK